MERYPKGVFFINVITQAHSLVEEEKVGDAYGPRHQDPHHRCPLCRHHQEVQCFQGDMHRHHIVYTKTRPCLDPRQFGQCGDGL